MTLPAEPLFVFDLDNTLYPPEVSLWRIVDARIELYVREKLGVEQDEARHGCSSAAIGGKEIRALGKVD